MKRRSEQVLSLHADCIVLKRILDKCVAHHQEEMAQIAQQVVIKTVPPMVEKIFAKLWNEAAERLIGAIEWDIQEVVSVAFDDMGEVFHSEKFRKVISSKIMEAIKKNIKGITIK